MHRTPFHTPLSRFSPHLSTISESPLNHLHRFSPISVRSTRRVIDTADIDVSSPRILSHNGNPPRNRLRRDRPTIKIRSQALKDNPALREHHERHEKSVGELLMEKFFIKDKKSESDGNQLGVRLYHQINLDRLEDPQEREAIQKQITRRFTRRRSSADLQLDPEQIQREAAYAQVQAKVLDSLVAEEQAQIENEARRGTLLGTFRKGPTIHRGTIERPYYANNVDSDTMTQEEEEAAATRIRKAMKKMKKKKRSSIDKQLSTVDKIDNRRSSTSSEISTDSPIKENDEESKPQMYKIEACNSAGDFSTIWVNRNSENERRKSTVEQFKENVRVPVPRRTGNRIDVSLNDTNEAETQVVLAVRKPYVKDPSRNSVYLTMRKPTEKFNEKLEEVNEFHIKVDEDQLASSFVDVENNILGSNALRDEISADLNCKTVNDINKDIKALKKTVCKSKKTKSLSRKDPVHSISNDDLWDKRDSVSATDNNIVSGDPSLLKKEVEIAANPVRSNVSISTNASKNNSQVECLSENIFITDIKNDESEKALDAEKVIDHLEADSNVFAIKNSAISVGRDKLAKKDRPKISALSHNEDTTKRSVVETESSDNVGKSRANGVMITTNSATCRLPKLSKINTDRNNAVEAPKLSLRETAEYLADSPKSDQDVVAVALPEKKMNKTSNLAQVFSFDAPKRTSDINADKSTFRIDAIHTQHDDAVKLEAKEATLPKEMNDKMCNNEYFQEAKLIMDVKPTKDVGLPKISRNKRIDGNMLALKPTDSSKTEAKVIVAEVTTDALKEAEPLKTDTNKKINYIVGKDSLRDLTSRSKLPKVNSANLKFHLKAETLLKNEANDSSVANSLKSEKDLDAFKTMKIEDDKSFFRNDADDETRVLKKSISADYSKLINDHSSNKILKVFQRSVTVEEKPTDKGVSVKKPSEYLSKMTEKNPMRLDVSCILQDENVLSRSASTESIDFWSEIKAPTSPETARSTQPNGFSFREATIPSPTSKVKAKMNLKWKDNRKENENDISIAGLKNSTIESSNIVLEEEKRIVISESLRAKEIAKTTEIEENVPKQRNLLINIKDANSTVKKTSLKHNNSDTATTPVEVAVPIIKIVEAPKLSEEFDNRKADEDPSTPTNELSPNLSLIRKISRWNNQDDLTNTDDVETPLASEETSLAASPSVSPQSSKKRAIKKKKATKKTSSEKSDKGSKETRELTMATNQQNTLKNITKLVPEKQHLAKPSPKTSPKSSPKNTPLQRPLDLIRMFYTTPSALLTATPRDLSKVRRAKIKRKRHYSRTSSISSDSTGSTTSTATTGSTDENGSTRVELDDDSEHKRMNSTRSNDSGFDGSPRISSTCFAIACASKFYRRTYPDSFQIFFLKTIQYFDDVT